MKKVEITLNPDGSYSCSQDKIYVGEHMAVELEITLPEDMQTGFESYALCLDPAGMCKKIVIRGIGDVSLNEDAKAYFSEGVIHCTLPAEFTGAPELFAQAEARRESDSSVTYVEKTGVFCIKFDSSLMGREFVTDSGFSGIFDPEKYVVDSLGHTHSYNSLLDLPELYCPDEDVHIKFVSTADEASYRVPAEITNPGSSVTLPRRAIIEQEGNYRRLNGWKLYETDEHIYTCNTAYTLPTGFKGTLTFFAHWSANYYNYRELYETIRAFVNRDVLLSNANDPIYECEEYRTAAFEEYGVNALMAELALANERINYMNCSDQFEVDMYTKRLNDLFNSIKLKKLPANIDCNEGTAHTHNWKQIVSYCFSLFGEDVTPENISVNTPIPEDCEFTDQSMEELRGKLVDLKYVLANAMSDTYRINELTMFSLAMNMLYIKYHGLTRKTKRVLDMISTAVTVTLEDGVEYKYGALSTLSITLPAESRYKTRITFSCGSTATVVAFTTMPLWAEGTVPEIIANRTYQIDIEDGLAVWRGFYAAI